MPDWRNIKTGRVIPAEGYCDQPYVVVNADGSWTCTMTTGRGREGEAGQGGALFLPNPPYACPPKRGAAAPSRRRGEGLAKKVKISDCDRNRAAQAGGALWINNRPGSVPLIEQTTFRFSSASVAKRPRGWTLPMRGGGAVFLLFCPHLPADGSNAEIVDWPFWWQTSFGGKRLMQKTDILTFRDCRFHGTAASVGRTVQSEPAFNEAERVFSWMPSWVFKDCRVDKNNWGDFRSRAHRLPGTEPSESPGDEED
jgi:hypothetical protein